MQSQIRVSAIYISPSKGEAMKSLTSVKALVGRGLECDRYAMGKGSWDKDRNNQRQVTLISSESFPPDGFTWAESRRNIITEGYEVNRLIGKFFLVGNVLMRGKKYCDPCGRISHLCGRPNFKEIFFERGGIIAEIFNEGIIRIMDPIDPDVEYSEVLMQELAKRNKMKVEVEVPRGSSDGYRD